MLLLLLVKWLLRYQNAVTYIFLLPLSTFVQHFQAFQTYVISASQVGYLAYLAFQTNGTICLCTFVYNGTTVNCTYSIFFE